MLDYYLVADTEQQLWDVLPDWLTDGIEILPVAETHAMFWDIPVPYSQEFHAVLRLFDMSRMKELRRKLGDFMLPNAQTPWQEVA